VTARGRGPVVATRRRLPPRRQPTTAEGGYGALHRRLREQTKRLVDAGGVLCWRCGVLIVPGETWDLGHDDAPAAKALGLYRGLEHRHCSRSAGRLRRRAAPGSGHPPQVLELQHLHGRLPSLTRGNEDEGIRPTAVNGWTGR
jgi:hypothetical protein